MVLLHEGVVDGGPELIVVFGRFGLDSWVCRLFRFYCALGLVDGGLLGRFRLLSVDALVHRVDAATTSLVLHLPCLSRILLQQEVVSR